MAEVNRTTCFPPLDVAEVDSIARSVCRYGNPKAPETLFEAVPKQDAANYVPPPPLRLKVVGFRPLGAVRAALAGADYLVKPIIQRDTTAIWFGESGALKTFVLLDVGLHAAYGIECHGMPCHQGAVFFICGEGQGGIARRVVAWTIGHNVTDDTARFFSCPMCLPVSSTRPMRQRSATRSRRWRPSMASNLRW